MSARSRAVGIVVLAITAAAAQGLPAQEAHEHGHDHGPPAQQDASGDVTTTAPAPPQRAGRQSMPRTPIPPLTAADRAAAVPPRGGHASHENAIHGFLLANRLELRRGGGETGMGWELQGWAGTDLNRLWLRSEGERSEGVTQAAEVEVLFGHSVTPWWDVLLGVRHDPERGPARTYAALGIQGLAPQWIETSATLYYGTGGRAGARLELEYELLFTNRLMLQPLLELTLWSRDDTARGLGSGLSTAEAGLRLRYEFARRFAPYLGVSHARTFGDTRDLRRATALPASETRAVAGVRIWF